MLLVRLLPMLYTKSRFASVTYRYVYAARADEHQTLMMYQTLVCLALIEMPQGYVRYIVVAGLHSSHRHQYEITKDMATLWHGHICCIIGPLWWYSRVTVGHHLPLMWSFEVCYVVNWTRCWTNNRQADDLRRHDVYVVADILIASQLMN